VLNLNMLLEEQARQYCSTSTRVLALLVQECLLYLYDSTNTDATHILHLSMLPAEQARQHCFTTTKELALLVQTCFLYWYTSTNTDA
jgi:hypothetical protein